MPSVLIHTSHEPLNHFRAQLKDELNKINDEEKKKNALAFTYSTCDSLTN